LQRREVFLRLVAVVPRVGQEPLLLRAGRGERRLPGEERRTGRALLLRLLGEHGRLLRHLRLDLGRLLPRDPHLVLQARDLVHDRAVLPADLGHVVDLVDQLGKALDLEEDVEDAGLVGLVDLNEPLLQAELRQLVLPPQVNEVPGLLLEAGFQAGQAGTVRGELALEDGQPV
jgi:hypothetical protein